jgi:hypothetical protein
VPPLRSITIAVEVDLPDRICTKELVTAVGTATVGAGVGAGAATGLGLTVGLTLGFGVGVGATVGDGDVPKFNGRNNISLAMLPRPPSAIVASVSPPASTANITRLPNVAATLSTLYPYCW